APAHTAVPAKAASGAVRMLAARAGMRSCVWRHRVRRHWVLRSRGLDVRGPRRSDPARVQSSTSGGMSYSSRWMPKVIASDTRPAGRIQGSVTVRREIERAQARLERAPETQAVRIGDGHTWDARQGEVAESSNSARGTLDQARVVYNAASRGVI